jgi:hypothetical protein
MTAPLQEYFAKQLSEAADLRIAADNGTAGGTAEDAIDAADAAEELIEEILDAAERARGDPSLLSALHYSLLKKYGDPPPVKEEICTYVAGSADAGGAAAGVGVMVCKEHWQKLSKGGVEDTCEGCGEVSVGQAPEIASVYVCAVLHCGVHVAGLLFTCMLPVHSSSLSFTQVIQDSALNAMGKKWHPAHFKCSTCSKSMPGQFIVADLNPDGSDSPTPKPYCAECEAPKPKFKMSNIQKKPAADPAGEPPATDCAACGKALNGKVVKALGKTFHRECMTCFACPAPPKCSRKGLLSCAEHGQMPFEELPQEAQAKLN